MRQKHKRHDEGISFWQSHADLLTALVLILLLIIALLIMYLLKKPDYDDYNEYETTSYIEEDYGGEEETETETQTETQEETAAHERHEDGGGGGGGGGDMPGDDAGDMPGEDEGIKSAVYAVLVDGETGKAIKEEGVEFELYGSDGGLVALNTYYPEKMSYRKFATRKDGTFYLPEKVWEREYIFRALTEAEGYDLAEDTRFSFDQMHDWPDPLVVSIPAFPSRNVIRVQMQDSATGQLVAGGAFRVIAAEDILTQDGTLRFAEGSLAGTIEIGENGYGESGELFLGKYLLVQESIPEYYAGLLQPVAAETIKKSEDSGAAGAVMNERTRIRFTLSDELYADMPVQGAEFTVYDGVSSQECVTDAKGEIVVDSVRKDTDYVFTQVSAPESYIALEEPVTVHVSADGRISGQAAGEAAATNRAIRTSFSTADALLGRALEGAALSLRDMSGNVLKSWTENGSGAAFTDIPEGEYELIVNNDESSPYQVTVRNTAEVQEFTARKMTAAGILAAAAAALAAGGIIAAAVFLARRAAKKRKGE